MDYVQIDDLGVEEKTRLERIARRVVWWKPPGETLDRPDHFLAHVMTYGEWGDWETIRNIFGDSIFKRVLDDPPAGVFDKRSWHYWHIIFKREVPPLPERKIPV